MLTYMEIKCYTLFRKCILCYLLLEMKNLKGANGKSKHMKEKVTLYFERSTWI